MSKRNVFVIALIALALGFLIGHYTAPAGDDAQTSDVLVETGDQAGAKTTGAAESAGGESKKNQAGALRGDQTGTNTSQRANPVEGSEAQNPGENSLQDAESGEPSSNSASTESGKENGKESPVSNEESTRSSTLPVKRVLDATLKGRVVDQRNQPVEGAFIGVEASMSSPDSGERIAAPSMMLAVTDARGEFSGSGVISLSGGGDTLGNLLVYAQHPDYLRSEPIRAVYLSSEAFKREGLTLVLRDGTRVSGRIVDERRSPLAGIELSFGDARVTTDGQGEFNSWAIERKPVTPTLRTPGWEFAETMGALELAELNEATLAMGDIVVRKRAALRFTLILGEDAAARGSIVVVDLNRDGNNERRQIKVGEGGQCMLMPEASGFVDLTLLRPGFQPLTRERVQISEHQWTELGQLTLAPNQPSHQKSEARAN